MRSIPYRLWALAMISGALQILPFPIAGPVFIGRRLICWVCLTPLLVALLARDKHQNVLQIRQAAALSYVSGVLWYLGNCYWIYQTMHIYGDIPKAASIGILLLFALYVGLYHALFGAIVAVVRRSFGINLVLFSVPFLWVAVELARARITGFPWDLLGYTLVDNANVAHLASLTGVMGLSFLVAFVNACWVAAVLREARSRSGLWLTAGGVLVVLALVLGIKRMSRPSFPVQANAVLLQENLDVGAVPTGPVETKTDLLNSFTYLSTHPSEPLVPPVNPNLIAWPESPADFFDIDPQFREAIGKLALQQHAPVVVNDISYGPRLGTGRFEEYNSAAFFLPDGTYKGRYDKMRLVPFGEYVPYKPLFFFAGDLLGSLPFIPGQQRKVFSSQGRTYGVFICYESIFGDDIRHFVKDGAEVLVNISDDGWYGDSSAPWEHLDMVRMRAIENGRWILRATNTGITVAIDPMGRITARLPRHIRGSLQASFGYLNGLTLYTRFGDWFGWLCVGVTALLLSTAFIWRRSKLEAV